MAFFIVGWVIVAFVLSLAAHALFNDDGRTDVDVTVTFGMIFALGLALGANHFAEQPL